MVVLAIDYGVKRSGLALWRSDARLALPIGVVENKQALVGRIRAEKADRIILGLPFGLDGVENDRVLRVREFGLALSEETGVAVDFYDERFTSVAADRMLGGVSRDEKAAMLILEGWLEKNKL